METPTFVLVVIWFAVACIGVLFGVIALALPSMFTWFRRARQLVKVESHHNIPPATVRRMDRDALVLQGETLYLAD